MFLQTLLNSYEQLENLFQYILYLLIFFRLSLPYITYKLVTPTPPFESNLNVTEVNSVRSSITAITDAKDGNPRAVLRAGGNSGGVPVTYARYVEFGTRKMAPRLFMGKAVRSAQKGVRRELKNLLVLALQAQ